MKKNNKGFMLVEVIVTSTVILTSMVVLYSGFNKLYTKYQAKNFYYSIDGVYATKEMASYLLEHDFNTFLNDTLYSSRYQFLIKDGECQISGEICPIIVSLYGVKNMIFTEYDKCDLVYDEKSNEQSKCGLVSGDFLPVQNETFKEYITYVIGYYNIEDANVVVNDGKQENEYSYLILTETFDSSDYYYANLRIR